MFPAVSHRFVAIVVLIVLGLTLCVGQTKQVTQKPNPPEQSLESLNIDPNLVTVPVTATDAGGVYVTDLRKEEFTITEDDVAQPIAFFGKVAAPVHVVLMLDTSSSTQDKLKQIQQAAFAFVQQLQPADRVKVISFDDSVKELSEFTNDRAVLRAAINGTTSGEGTKVYDAFDLALKTIDKVPGRKAIVIFTDGMDWHSDYATLDGTLRYLDQEGVVVYPIRYDTRAITEKSAREQQSQATPELPTIDVVRRPGTGGTGPTFPSEDPTATSGSKRNTGPMGLPSADEIMRRRREQERNRYPVPTGGPAPTGDPSEIPPNPNDPDKRRARVPGSKPTNPEPSPRKAPTGGEDSIAAILDRAYLTADKYLQALAEKSGGRLLRADTLVSLPAAFSQIAAELRTQYMLGYYPVNKEPDERYRKIKVTTTRKGVLLRARPGYLAMNAQ